MSKLTKIVAFLMLTACGGSEMSSPEPSPATERPDSPIQEPIGFNAAGIEYRPCPPPLPDGCEMAILEGDPRKSGIFTMRVRAPGAFTTAPHGHPSVERVTVLEGTVHIAFGDTVDKSQGRAYSAGDFYINPANAIHYVWADGPATLQVTGHGPRAFVPASND